MPIRNLMRYDLPEGFELEKEENILELLRDVRKSINHLEYTFETNELKKVLSTIERGKHIIKSWVTKDTEVDLSNAYEFIREYKLKSEGGCQSCEKIIIEKPFSDEGYSYCELNETREDVNGRIGRSPKIEKYSKKECHEKISKLRPIEEVLKGVEY